MKKLVGLLVIIIALSNSINAQGNGKRANQNFTPEQIATLQTKRMTMLLNLSQEQQTAIVNLQKNQAMVRQAMRKSMLERKLNGKTLSSDELFQLQSSRLDRMQQHKIAMQKILNQEQFSKWQTMRKGKMMSKQGCNNPQRKGQQKFKRQS
ncbi:hypothetical protein Lupro_11430 [Lutibacter profundi]|uniref:P pilus assembly/Cpx signaling pathway, periplasmic inhibitor/zinc-resistance associated protein n=1 Tax=Lutibacter profundi TaxID=1622118 RepID=A0A0X8G887_9FLAO|nr:hypothetical protein [Lutibacter profundi]AMC11838.1 hypothetical protein Lupro_11430 [Lutibacter profundi]